MPYCRDCGAKIYGNDIYCNSCEIDIINISKRRIRDAEESERRRIKNDRVYAHRWLQSLIGWIVGLMGIISKLFTGGCYIATAVNAYKGLGDFSSEMKLLRDFKKDYILESEDITRIKELHEYYVLGQIITNWVNSRIDSELIWEFVSKYIYEVVSLIKENQYDRAYLTFKNHTLSLRKDILGLKHILTQITLTS